MDMQAAYITEPGPARSIRFGPLPAPEPGPDEVLVRVEVVAVNHVDTFVRAGAYVTELPMPFVIGRDLVGTVVRAGPETSGFARGTPVWCNSLGHAGRQGSFAEYAVVPAERLYPLPAGVDPVAAVAVLHTAGTAHLGLFREARTGKGDTVVLAGAGGGVGSAAVRLASSAGARVIAVDRADNADWCRDCGAAEFVDRADPGLDAAIARLAPSGVDVYWDCSGRPDLASTLRLLAIGGRVVLSAGLSARAELPVGQCYTRDISLHGFAISNASVTDLADAADAINAGLANGWLHGRIRAHLPLAEAAVAHELMGRPGRPGRIVLHPWPGQSMPSVRAAWATHAVRKPSSPTSPGVWPVSACRIG